MSPPLRLHQQSIHFSSSQRLNAFSELFSQKVTDTVRLYTVRYFRMLSGGNIIQRPTQTSLELLQFLCDERSSANR